MRVIIKSSVRVGDGGIVPEENVRELLRLDDSVLRTPKIIEIGDSGNGIKHLVDVRTHRAFLTVYALGHIQPFDTTYKSKELVNTILDVVLLANIALEKSIGKLCLNLFGQVTVVLCKFERLIESFLGESADAGDVL